jgi:methionyl-tRNA synthetase
MYVWLDALTNYITGLGYPDGASDWERYWPADIHLIGKDVVRFHAVYWPAFLMSAGVELPKCVYGHGHVLLRGEKMSKSAGNVVDPLDMAERFGVDQVRYFLMREISFGQDGSYSDEAIITRANAELANSFGNLAQRTFSMIFKNLGGVVPPVGEDPEDKALLDQVRAGTQKLTQEFEELSFSAGLEAWMSAVFACNSYVDAMAPWALRKTDPERMEGVLGTLAQAVGLLTKAIEPVVPTSAARLLDYIEAGRREGRIAAPQPIFPRLELEPAE